MNERLEPLDVIVSKEVVIPRTREGYEEKSFIFYEKDGKLRSVFSRKIELFCLPNLTGFSFNHELDFADTYIAAWNILKDRGFNVVDNAWKLNSQKVITTNLIEFGGGVYDQKIDAIIERDTLKTDGEFVNIPIRDVQKEAQKIVDLANKTGVELMTDGPFHIVVTPDGGWYLIILDIGKVRIKNNPKTLGKNEKHNNQYFSDKALREFAKIQSNINTLRLARGLS